MDSNTSWKGNSNTENNIVNPRELDVILSEMVLISQRTFLYNNFVNYRAMVYILYYIFISKKKKKYHEI